MNRFAIYIYIYVKFNKNVTKIYRFDVNYVLNTENIQKNTLVEARPMRCWPGPVPGSGPVARGQGPGARGQWPGARGQGPGARGQGPGACARAGARVRAGARASARARPGQKLQLNTR